MTENIQILIYKNNISNYKGKSQREESNHIN